MALDTAPALPLRLLSRLATPLLPDDYLELINPLWSQRSLKARVVDIHKETAEATTITLQPPSRWQGHRAGQYVRIGIAVDGVRHSRCYSISSAPSQVNGRFQITVKAIADGRVSQHLNRRLQLGEVIDISPAEGAFCWPTTMPEQALFISAGSGITPMMSLALDAAARGQLPRLTWLHYAPTRADVIFGERLQALAAAHPQIDLQILLTREGDAHFSAAELTRRCPDWATRATWSCGPAALLDAVEALWAVTPTAAPLTVERFRANVAAASDAEGGTIRFLKSGGGVSGDGCRNLLETAEDAGLLPAHGCRMGICHGCTVKLKSGQVRDLRTGQVFGEEDDLIQICVCAPAGDVALEM
jgi:ferredoxin-NADP reductase